MTAFAASLLAQIAAFVVFWWIGRLSALTVAMVGGNRNMGVVLATLGNAATPELALFFVAVQFPIYVLPAALRPIYRNLGAKVPERDP
jgi:BASS family bile acid:Na+ symporter